MPVFLSISSAPGNNSSPLQAVSPDLVDGLVGTASHPRVLGTSGVVVLGPGVQLEASVGSAKDDSVGRTSGCDWPQPKLLSFYQFGEWTD